MKKLKVVTSIFLSNNFFIFAAFKFLNYDCPLTKDSVFLQRNARYSKIGIIIEKIAVKYEKYK